MNIKRTISAAISLVFVGGLLLVASGSANGQGRYSSKYSKRDVSGIITKLEQSSNTFRSDFDKAMDKSNLNGTPTEDRFNNLVKDFENSLDRLRRDFDRNDSWWQSRSQVENTIRDSRPVNTMMATLSFRRNIERQWNQLRSDINTLADTFDLPGLEGGGWNGGGGNGGGTGSRPPTWARGTFYSTNGSGITLTIDQNGSVSAYVNGQTYYGTYNGSEITLNNDVSTVAQNGNGIRTYNRNTGETTNYSRTNNGGGGGGGGNTSTPPSWARGTFYSTNGNGTTVTINQNGSVTAYVNGQTYNGTFYRNEITLNNDVSTISQNGNGIRTYNRNTGETTNYSRTNNGGGGGNTSAPPTWARGTFYSTNGTNIQLTINANGSVSVYTGGQTYYGTYYQGALTLNNDTSTISRNGNGIRTYNRNTGQTTDYRRR